MSQEEIAIKYICKYLIGLLQRFNFNTKVKRYTADMPENVLLGSIEDVKFFRDRSGYVVMAGIDGMEYISGNQPSLAIDWYGARPNINYTQLPIPDIADSQKKTLQVLSQGGGFFTYPWIDPRTLVFTYRIHESYVQMYDTYLYFNITYAKDGTKGDAAIPVLMCDVLQQLISNFWLYSENGPHTYGTRFNTAINDGHMALLSPEGNLIAGTLSPILIQKALQVVKEKGGGYIASNTFCTQIPYYNSIVTYTS